MTAVERTMLKAQIALLRSQSPTKGSGLQYTETDWRQALTRVSDRLSRQAYRRQAR